MEKQTTSDEFVKNIDEKRFPLKFAGECKPRVLGVGINFY